MCPIKLVLNFTCFLVLCIPTLTSCMFITACSVHCLFTTGGNTPKTYLLRRRLSDFSVRGSPGEQSLLQPWLLGFPQSG